MLRGVEAGAQVPGRPRPVAGLPPLPAEGVARAWLLGLIAGRPLERAAGLPVAALADQAPSLARAVAAALSDDEALDALPAQGAAVARLCGTTRPDEVVAAVEVLRAAVDAHLREAVPETADAAGARLAHVCAVLAAAAVAPEAADPERHAAQLLAALEPPSAVVALEADGEPPAQDPRAPGVEVVRAGPGRWFLVGPALGARALAERLTGELPGVAGLAIRHRDEDPLALVGVADERLFAARAQGVPLL